MQCFILNWSIKILLPLFSQNVFGRCEGKCDVSIENRSYCKRCRMNKCIAIGMKREMLISKWPETINCKLHFRYINLFTCKFGSLFINGVFFKSIYLLKATQNVFTKEVITYYVCIFSTTKKKKKTNKKRKPTGKSTY